MPISQTTLYAPNHIEDYASKKVLDQMRFCVPIKALQ